MSKLHVAAAVLAAICALPASAKDLSALQTAAEIARQEMDGAQADYNADTQRVAASRKNLEEAQKRLAADQKQAAASQQRYREAKARYDRAQATLDKAWK